MVKVIGLTGGIGSGKTTVAKLFKELGIAVYIADKEAKLLMKSSIKIKQKIITLLGKNAYRDRLPNKKFIAEQVFNNTPLLNELNAIIHPELAIHFKAWIKKQTGTYIIKEAAILFESGAYKTCDKIILITAPEALRIERVLQRDTTTKEAILARIKHQLSDNEKIKNAHFVINNINLEDTKKEVFKIHNTILSN